LKEKKDKKKDKKKVQGPQNAPRGARFRMAIGLLIGFKTMGLAVSSTRVGLNLFLRYLRLT
jgi:hypothetical protein